jgi:hypothetical protein
MPKMWKWFWNWVTGRGWKSSEMIARKSPGVHGWITQRESGEGSGESCRYCLGLLTEHLCGHGQNIDQNMAVQDIPMRWQMEVRTMVLGSGGKAILF